MTAPTNGGGQRDRVGKYARVGNIGSGHADNRGAIFGDHNITTVINDNRYQGSATDSPDRKFERAKNLLDGNQPRAAEELFKECIGVSSGETVSYTPNELAYYLSITALSGRSFDLLRPEEFETLNVAYGLRDRSSHDEWSVALDFVHRLDRYLRDRERTGFDSSAELDDLIHALDRLSEKRRDELLRHLKLVLTGAVQDRLKASLDDAVRRNRTARDRSGRVWKFFHPIPAPPRRNPVQKPVLGRVQRHVAIAAAVLIGAGSALAIGLACYGSPEPAVIAVVLMAIGGVLAAPRWPSLFPGRYDPRPKPTEFSDQVDATIRREFGRRAPDGPGRQFWAAATQAVKTRLANDIVDTYSEPAVGPGGVDWLIRWNSKQARQRWDSGELRYRVPFLPQLRLAGGLLLSIVGWAIVLTAAAAAQPAFGFLAFGWPLLGGVLAVASRADVHLVRLRAYPGDEAVAARLAEEQREYERWSRKLADRPSDAEMAEWLDYDKLYLKTLAVNQYGLADRDVITHATLSQPAAGSRRARVRNGPVRGSAYAVWVFLLTKAGVRMLIVDLDFATGRVQNQERRAFRYDAITSASVREIGERLDAGRRETLLPRTDGERPEHSASTLLAQEFSLTFNDGRDITLVWANDRPSAGQDMLSADTSDFVGALQILEAVSADGREWLEQARTRIRHLLRDDPPPANWRVPADGGPVTDGPPTAAGGPTTDEPPPAPGADDLAGAIEGPLGGESD